MADQPAALREDFDQDVLDALADLAVEVDEPPDALSVPDEPDPNQDRDASPRPEDGPQDVSQEPDAYDREPGGSGPEPDGHAPHRRDSQPDRHDPEPGHGLNDGHGSGAGGGA